MARSSIYGAERAPARAPGRDTDALGPSDTSDSGSDVQGEPDLEGAGDDEERLGAVHTDRSSDSDSAGTGERGSARDDEDVREGNDIAPDSIEHLAGADTDLAVDAADLEDTEGLENIDEEQERPGEEGDVEAGS